MTTRPNPHSSDWLAVEAFIKERLDYLYDLLSTVGVEERQADVARGRIAELKELRNWPLQRIEINTAGDINV